ncbi:anti-Muellerian hormone type-2 receptor isoform X2 [Engystomops pustulosus]|uniref:anti-Muellerian hormone type-2 receptor isoform X2 n=1 Tax=Engystomops pustulosus TaxID=76066 RepID=UPI003AFB8195
MPHTGLNFIIHLSLFLASLRDVHLKGISCAIFENGSYSVGLPMAQLGNITEPGKIHCSDSNCCMGMWSISNGEIQLVVLGCYPSHAICRSETCDPVYRQGRYHCLCSTDMCNTNVTFSAEHITKSELERCAPWNASCDWMKATREQPCNSNSFRSYVAVFVAIVAIFLLLIILVFIKVIKSRHCMLVRGEALLENQELHLQAMRRPPTQPVEGLILHQAIREDSLSANLWLGAMYGNYVIVKSFPPPMKERYSQEWRILNLLTPLQHENIVCLLAAGSGTEGILKHHQLLVFQHYPEGSLKNYLTSRKTNWDTACRMAISLARGLAFLHSDRWNGDTSKPAIAHRDLSSDNILVTADSSCVIADFGLSVVLENWQTKRKPKDSAILNMKGTLRYMSPEMLDGSLNLVSWKLALTQADVYSLGLLLWEIFSRCSDLYADHQCPEFQVAFLDELGPNPTLDELRSMVVENKLRPKLPRDWNKNPQLFKTLWETLEDCWDPDNEARLSAQCAQERLCNLLPVPLNLLAEGTI